MPITYNYQRKFWVLSTNDMDYALGVDSKGCIQHLYWGGKLHSMDDYPSADDLPNWGWEDVHGVSREEIMPWGGLRFSEPGLKTTFPNGTRDLNLVFETYRMDDENEVILTLTDTVHPLKIDLHYKVIEAYDIIERHIRITNEGSAPVLLEQVMSAYVHLPVFPNYRLTYLTGHWGAETQIRQEYLNEGKKILEGRRGNTGHQYNPWFAIDFGHPEEEQGKVYYGALAYSGNWKIVVEKTPYETLGIAAGIHDFDFSWELEPNQSFTSPIFVSGFSKNGFGSASRKMHRYQWECIMPKKEIRPVLYNSWEATAFNVTEEGQKALAKKAAALGVELFVVDDGWFGQRHHDQAGLGDWYVNKEKFPSGLTTLIEYVKSLGMKFGIWVEPEMVNPDSDLYREHPDWVYHFPERQRTLCRHQAVLNLCRPDVQEFILGFMDDLLGRHDISFIKWDMNRYFSEPGWPGFPAAKQKEIWVRHVRSLYQIWEQLRKKYPHVAFEACSGGGGRVDLGIMAYADQYWPSDNTDPFDRLKIQEGFSHAYNVKSMVSWVTDVPNFLNRRTSSLKYRFHAAMTGTLGIGLDLNKCSTEELEECKELIGQYKQIRAIVQEGSLYRLLSPRSSNTSAVEYVSPDQSQAILFAFGHGKQFGHNVLPIRMRGLNSTAIYYSPELDIQRSGAFWMSQGVLPKFQDEYDSVMVTFNKV